MPKILIVEDDANLADIYKTRLIAEQFEVVTATDGEQALSWAMKEKPDLIILDIMMPKISGFDVLDILRSTPETKDTKVIIMSALGQDADMTKGQRLGADKYLVKSQVTLEDVVRSVREVLAKPRPTEQPPAQEAPIQQSPQPPQQPPVQPPVQQPPVEQPPTQQPPAQNL